MKNNNNKKKERTIIVHVSSPFMSRFLLLVLIMKFLPQILSSALYSFFSVHPMHIFSLNNQAINEKKKNRSFSYDLKKKKKCINVLLLLSQCLHLNDEKSKRRRRKAWTYIQQDRVIERISNHKHKPCFSAPLIIIHS